jgi:hypothetical protein
MANSPPGNGFMLNQECKEDFDGIPVAWLIEKMKCPIDGSSNQAFGAFFGTGPLKGHIH